MKFFVSSECIGCGQCVTLCPQVFRMENGVARALEGDAPIDLIGEAVDAIDACPVSAISSGE